MGSMSHWESGSNGMKKIVTLGIQLKDEHQKRLAALGELVVASSPDSVEDLLLKSTGADVIFSNGSYLLESLPHLKNVLVTYPYVELGVFDSEALKKNGVLVANAQGGNRDSIVEWVMFMALSLFRQFTSMICIAESQPLELQQSLQQKRVLIVGKGSIGTQIGKACEAFGMKVAFFKRGDDLQASSAEADLVINALNSNSSSKNLLNEAFFMSLKKGAYFISFVRSYTYDLDGLIKAIDAGVVAGAGIDCDPEVPGNATNTFYQKALSCPKVLVTPHIAFATKQAVANGAEIAVQNIEAFLKGQPINVISKK
jgi:D-2-hydroxyacid dehydrogenase (NADP+)